MNQHLHLILDREGRAREVVARIQIDTSAILDRLARRRRRLAFCRDVAVMGGAMAVPVACGFLWGRVGLFIGGLSATGALAIVGLLLSLERRLP